MIVAFTRVPDMPGVGTSQRPYSGTGLVLFFLAAFAIGVMGGRRVPGHEATDLEETTVGA